MNQKLSKKTIQKISALLVIIVLSFAIVIGQQKNGSRYPWRIFTERHRRQPVSEREVSRISKWMTFDYINEVFALPSSYLKDTLTIRNSKYPFITLEEYSKSVNIEVNELINIVQDAVRLHLKQPSSQ